MVKVVIRNLLQRFTYWFCIKSASTEIATHLLIKNSHSNSASYCSYYFTTACTALQKQEEIEATHNLYLQPLYMLQIHFSKPIKSSKGGLEAGSSSQHLFIIAFFRGFTCVGTVGRKFSFATEYAAMIAVIFEQGISLVQHSNINIPKLYTSAELSYGSCLIISGAIHLYVPVSGVNSSTEEYLHAKSKPPRCALPLESRNIFADLISRCMYLQDQSIGIRAYCSMGLEYKITPSHVYTQEYRPSKSAKCRRLCFARQCSVMRSASCNSSLHSRNTCLQKAMNHL